jgi:hypothetical protein
MKNLIELMRLVVENLIKNEFIASFATFLFLIWRLKCKNLIYFQLKLLKLFCKNNVTISEHTVAISQVKCVFVQKFTQTYSKI